MAQIISIKKTTQSYHPATGNTYTVELSDGREGEASDDCFLGMFKELRYPAKTITYDTLVQRVIGKTWDEDYNLL